MKTVFISSTSKDLEEYRKASVEICLRLGFHPIAMEYFAAMPVGATAGSKRELDKAELYVGIFAHRYGYIEDKTDGRGVTEIEFDYAGERGLDRLCFVVDPKFAWPPEYTDHENHDKLVAFKKKVDNLIRAQFTDVNDFRVKLTQALTEWNGANPERPGATSATHVTDPDDVPDKPRKLIGRDDLKADVTKLLEGGERVLLQGFGGQGKTALAATLGAEWIKAGKGSLLWLKTGSAPTEALFEALARPFGQHQAIARETGDNQITLLRQILRGSGISLLVLDDCWNGAALNTVLRAVPSDLPVLLTARQRYPIEGQTHEVEQLAPPDALALLGYHAGVVFPPTTARTGHPEGRLRTALSLQDAVNERESDGEKLCAVLGYHAFALEIAGKTLKANQWTAGELLKKIEAAPEQLELPLDFRVEGRESVAKLIEVSLNALDEEARTVFLVMGAFFALQMTAEMVGLYFEGATPTAASETPTPTLPRIQGRESIVKHLTTLVQHGLVARVDERGKADGNNPVPTAHTNVEDVTAYRLHDLAYSYARAQNNDEQRGRALDACLAYVARYNEPSLANFAALRPELDNLLNAASWAFEAGQYTAVEEFTVGLWLGSEILDLQGFSTQAIILLERAADATGRTGNKHDQGVHLGNLGNAYSNLGLVRKAIEKYEWALSISNEIGDRHSESAWLGNLGNAYYNLGQLEKAIAYYVQALNIHREIGDRRGEGDRLSNLGAAYRNLGQVEKAIDYHEQALTVSREIGDRRGEGNRMGNLGVAYRDLNQIEKAIEYLKKALSLSRDIGDRRSEGLWLGNLGNSYGELQQFDRAEDYFQQSILVKRGWGINHKRSRIDLTAPNGRS